MKKGLMAKLRDAVTVEPASQRGCGHCWHFTADSKDHICCFCGILESAPNKHGQYLPAPKD